jgi:hypothetical protein
MTSPDPQYIRGRTKKTFKGWMMYLAESHAYICKVRLDEERRGVVWALGVPLNRDLL